jgi:hypothetical protein
MPILTESPPKSSTNGVHHPAPQPVGALPRAVRREADTDLLDEIVPLLRGVHTLVYGLAVSMHHEGELGPYAEEALMLCHNTIYSVLTALEHWEEGRLTTTEEDANAA